MKVSMRPEKTYTLVLNGEDSPGWKEVSRWEGMAKLQRGSEVCIVCMPTPFEELFSELIGDEATEAEVVKASPMVFAGINANPVNRDHNGTAGHGDTAEECGAQGKQ